MTGPRRRLLAAAAGVRARGLVLAATTAGLFGLNAAVTGELNYQGGERKTFYGTSRSSAKGTRKDVTFGNSGQWMTTDTAGPAASRAATRRRDRGAEPARSAPRRSAPSFLRNLWLLLGRTLRRRAALLPAGRLALLAPSWQLGPRDRAGWLALAALAVSYLFYIRMIPDNWYGGSGTVGNRYFLNLLPLACPPGPARPRVRWWPRAGLAVPALFTGPDAGGIRCAHSLRPGASRASRGPFRVAPGGADDAERPVRVHRALAQEAPYGDTEGDAHKGWPADPKAYYLYFLDDGTYGREALATGWRLLAARRPAGGGVLRALEPVTTMRVTRRPGGPAGDDGHGARGPQPARGAGTGRDARAVFERRSRRSSTRTVRIRPALPLPPRGPRSRSARANAGELRAESTWKSNEAPTRRDG